MFVWMGIAIHGFREIEKRDERIKELERDLHESVWQEE